MAERLKTLVCTFDPASPRITAYDIHERIYVTLKLPDSDVHIIQIDRFMRQAYTKMADQDKMLDVLRDRGGQIEYIYPTCQISMVTLAMAGLGIKHIRVANLPPEVSHEALRASLTSYGKILDKQVER
jgi:hypothetical protein